MYQSISIPQLLDEWLAWAEWISTENRDESLAQSFAGFDEFCWIVEHEPEKAWLAIVQATKEPRFLPYLGNLAAGPLEDLIAQHGDLLMDRVEVLAKQDESFAQLLQGVWQYKMKDKTWARVQAVAKNSAKSENAASSKAPRGDA